MSRPCGIGIPVLPTQTAQNQIVIAASTFDHCLALRETVRGQALRFRPWHQIVPAIEFAVQAVPALNEAPQESFPRPSLVPSFQPYPKAATKLYTVFDLISQGFGGCMLTIEH